MHTLFCGNPFPATAAAFTGPNQNGPPSCPAPRPGPARDGVWLQPGTPPRGARPVTVGPGTVVLEQRHSRRDHVQQLWYHSVLIDIGIGPDLRLQVLPRLCSRPSVSGPSIDEHEDATSIRSA